MDDVQGGNDPGGSVAPAATPAAAPTPIELSPDAFVKVPGQDQPVKFSDYLSGYVPKSELTRMRQSDTQRLQQEREAFQQERQRAEHLLLQQAQTLAQAMHGRGQQVPEWLQEVQSAQYLDGPTAAKLVNRLMQEGVGPVHQRTQQIEQGMGMLLRQIQQQQQQIDQFQQRFRSTEDDSTLNAAMKLAGVPADNDRARAWFKSLYDSHEGAPGEDYRAVFPQWAVDQWNEHRRFLRELDRSETERQRPAVPGRSGQVSSLNPLPDDSDKLSPADIVHRVLQQQRGSRPT